MSKTDTEAQQLPMRGSVRTRRTEGVISVLAAPTCERSKELIAAALKRDRDQERQTAPAIPAPRYDEIFSAGLEWLDSL